MYLQIFFCFFKGEVGKGLKLIQEAVDLRKELGVPLDVAAGYCDLGSEYLRPPLRLLFFCLSVSSLSAKTWQINLKEFAISYGLDTRLFLITTNVPHVDDGQFEFQPVMYGRRDPWPHPPDKAPALIWY